MRRSPSFVLALLAGLLALPALAHAAPPRPVLLSDGWEFRATSDGPWKRVSVPHVFDGQADEARFEGQISWYRLRFTAPEAAPGGAWALRFEAVRRRAQVFLNGRRLGTNSDPYTPFQLTAQGLEPGENVLSIRVDNRRTPGFREGWWNWGGITRRVHLVPLGRVAMRDVGLLPNVSCGGICRASVRVDGWIRNRSPQPQRPLVAIRLQAPDGGRATQRTVRLRTIRPGETARIDVTVPVPGEPKLWTPERPQRYSATIQARVGDTIEQSVNEHVGLRTVTVRDGRLLLNGRQLQLRGASIQEDVPGRGPAMTDEDIAEVVRQLKAVNANVTRAHYLLDERLLDAFDEAGILVWSQAPVYHRDVQLRDPGHRERELATVRRTVLEARRHPSVLTHSVANELSPRPDANEATRDFLVRAAAITRDLDPTVPVSLDVLAWPGFERQRTYDEFELLGVNSYFGWYQGDEAHPTGDLRDLEPFLADTNDKYPDHALVMTEFGAEATMDGPVDVKETFAFQERYLRQYFEIIRRHPYMSGAIYWTLREFAVKPDWDGGALREGIERDGIHDKGLVEYETGERKPAWDVASREFARTPLYRTAPSRAVAAATDAAPAAAKASTATLALASVLITLLLALAGGLLWLLRDVLRFGDRPPAARYSEPEPGERRLRAVA